MSTFLEDTLDHVSQLPNEVRRALDLLHGVDVRWQTAMLRWRGVQEQLLTRARARVAGLPRDGSVDLRAAALPPGDALVAQCAALQATCAQLAEHKCAAAEAAEELVRLHVDRLDADCRRFEAELRARGELQDTEASAAGGMDEVDEDEGAGAAAGAGSSAGAAQAQAQHHAQQQVRTGARARARARGRTRKRAQARAA